MKLFIPSHILLCILLSHCPRPEISQFISRGKDIQGALFRRGLNHNSHLHLKLQADLTNIPRTPLENCKEISKGITKEEVEALACKQILSPLQQELMDWHHRLYHLLFSKLFRLMEKGHLLKNLLKCKGLLPLCVTCKFGAAHYPPWCWCGKHQTLFVGRNIFSPATVSPWTKLSQTNLGWSLRCQNSSLVTVFGDAQLSAIMWATLSTFTW